MSEVTLRSPFAAEDVPRIWTWMQPFFWRVSDDFSPKTLADFLPYYRALEERGTSWGVYRSGELGGVINYERLSPIVGSFHVIFKRSFWGRATTRAALEAAIPRMFEHCEKLTVPVVSGNNSMISLMSSVGAQREGLLKAHTRRDGKPVDLVMMAIFKPDTSAERKAT